MDGSCRFTTAFTILFSELVRLYKAPIVQNTLHLFTDVLVFFVDEFISFLKQRLRVARIKEDSAASQNNRVCWWNTVMEVDKSKHYFSVEFY